MREPNRDIVGTDPLGVGSSSWAFPLVGRRGELTALDAMLEQREHPVASAVVCGEGGIGKSRLVGEVAHRAGRRGWTVARGRAYPVERGVPYALFSDAFLPVLRALEPGALSVLSRGGESELRYLFPQLDSGNARVGQVSGGDPEEFRTRLLWNFTEFLKNYATRNPLLIVLEDLHWADASSLQLLHFVVRQVDDAPIFLLCSYNDQVRDENPHLAQLERSLVSLRLGCVFHLEPLSRDDVADLVARTFHVDPGVVREFSSLLHGWTRGNPFFLEEIIKSLVASGRLRRQKGTWIGWDARRFGLPRSIRDAVLARMAGLSGEAQRVADLAAVVGSRAGYHLLESVSGLEPPVLLAALEELCAERILLERSEGRHVVYDFTHPLVRETLYSDFGIQRTRILHGAVAEAMKGAWDTRAIEHADELAFHYARTDSAEYRPEAIRYLAEAGRRALRRHADREAGDYLRAAVERLDRSPGGPDDSLVRTDLLTHLARAHMRLGEYDEAIAIWTEMLQRAPEGASTSISLRRFLGLAHFWSGRPTEALEFFREGLAAAIDEGSDAEAIQLYLARSACRQELGRGRRARNDVAAALPLAEKLGDTRLLARVHRSLALLHVWIGPPDEARRHAEQAIALARDSGDLTVEFWARWALAVLAGMTGDIASMATGIDAAKQISETLRSPVLALWIAEMSIELAYATGDWDQGVLLGEQSIARARGLKQRALLPRLLVWTSMVYSGRGQLDRARELVDEACEISGMGAEDAPLDVHLVVPAHIGLGNYYLAAGRYQDAIRVAREGLHIAEGTGYVLWAVHRLQPILAEAHLWAEEVEEAERVGRQMRAHSEALDHKLGIAWADACDALVLWKRGDSQGGADKMQAAAEALEAIPMIPYAARLRRQLAGRLAEIGERDRALQELKHVHEIFARLGAERELDKTRIQFREVGSRPPPKGTGDGVAGLTPREMEIAGLVGRRKSNKGVAKELGISPRTVSTHLSHIFQKLGLTSRGQLVDFMREKGFPGS